MRLHTVIIALAMLLMGVLHLSATEKIFIKKGILDLREVNLNAVKEISFSGEWEFYWNVLLTSDDFANNNLTPHFVYVPSYWNDYKINKEKLPYKGAATYRMKVFLRDTSTLMAFKFGSIGTAFNLFVNGKQIYNAGTVSLNEKQGRGGYNPGVVTFMPNNDTVEVIFHISNYHYCKGGIWNGFSKIGTAKHLINSWNRQIQLSMIIIGIMVIFALYHLSLYFLNKRFRYTLYFSLFCIIVVIRTLVVNEFFILDLYPDFNWSLLTKIEYFTMLGGTMAFSLFIYKFFEEFYSFKVLKAIIAICTAASLVIFFTPVVFFTKFLGVYQAVILLASGYVVYVIIRSVFANNKSAIAILIGFIVLLITVVNDILYTNKVIETTFLTSFGFAFFIFLQAHMLSARFSALLNKSDDLANKLELANTSLEDKVEKRTAKIKEQNHQLKEQSDEILETNKLLEQVNDEILAQRDNLKLQNEIVNTQKKQITSSIEYASRIQGAVLDSANEIQLVAPDNFILYHPKDIVSGDFYWFKEINVNNKKYKIATVVDCTGHGVPGAFMSILGALLLNRIVGEINTTPSASEILNEMRLEVKVLLQQNKVELVKDGMEMSLIIIDYDNMEMQYAGAHSPLYIIRNFNGEIADSIEEYKGDIMPVGAYVKEKDSFTNHTIPFQSNDLVYLFTDGYHDQFGGERGTKLTRKVFKQLLLQIAHKKLSHQKTILEQELFNWRGKYEQIDDITIVGVKL